MAVGLVAALVIILSQTYTWPEAVSKAATEQTDSKSGADQTVIKAPGDAMPQSTGVRVDEQVPQSVLEILSEPDRIPRIIPQAKLVANVFIKTLFRVIIAPNAP